MLGSAVFRTGVAPGGVLAGPWVRNSLWTAARAVPTLDLRFADNKSLVDAVTGASLVTFTRASSGTFVGSDGVVQTAATDVPRFDHNPTTGESLGLLVEEARTNLWLQSQFASSWTPTRATLQVNDIVAPDATMTGAKLIEDTTATSTHLITQSISVTSGTTYTVSVFVKATASPRFLQFIFPSSAFSATRRPVFDLVNGTALAATDTTASIQNFGNGWYRCIASMSATVTGSAALQLQLADTYTNATSTYTGNGVSGVYIWGAQVEAGAFATSYIPTTTATVTRAADVASISGANFSSWYRQDEGTVFSDCVGTHSATQILVNIGATAANTGASSIAIASNLTSSQKRVRVRDAASADQASLALGASSSGSRTRIAAAIKADDFAASLDGGAAVTDTTGTVPTVALMEIGSVPSGVNLGTQLHRRLTYWPVRFAGTTLQAITQP